MKNKKWNVLALMILGFVVLGLGLLAEGKIWWQTQPRPSPALSETSLSQPRVQMTDPEIGLPTAAVTVVEFGDFTCEACAEAQGELNKALLKFPGLVRVVWKDFPMSVVHPEPWQAAIAARCAAKQGKFAEYQAELFALDGALSSERYLSLANTLGLDKNAFTVCQQDPGMWQKVEQSRAEGVAVGVESLPFYFIGDKKFSGVISSEIWQSYFQQAIHPLVR